MCGGLRMYRDMGISCVYVCVGACMWEMCDGGIRVGMHMLCVCVSNEEVCDYVYVCVRNA